jgi:cytochrome P450
MSVAPAQTPSMADRFFMEAMSPAFHEDPYPYYERFRAQTPLLRVGATIWFALGLAEVSALLRHPRLSSDESHASGDAQRAEIDANRPRSLLFMDPPEHTRLRGLVARAFTPRRIEDLRTTTAAIAADLLDAMPQQSEAVDLIQAFAYPLPVRVICALLGVPPEDEAMFTAWSRGVSRSVDPPILRTPEIEVAVLDARKELTAYIGSLLAERRRLPGDDLLSALAAVNVDGDQITSDEVETLARLLLIAGHETTVNLIGNGMLALLRAPEQLALLRRSPKLIEPAVDELLRFDGPVQVTQRIVLEDMEIAGSQLKRGDKIMLVLGAANRDPAAFADPHQLDVTRDARRHVAFGGGIHHCLGAALARMEGHVAFSALLGRFGTIELAGQPTRRPNFTLRGLESLPVRLAA